MIAYFSGTGNSRYVAQALARHLHEDILNMETRQPFRGLETEETLGLVFPVYAWGVPGIVEDFLRDMEIGRHYVWTVMTCGDDMGYADRVLERILGRKLDAAFSVGMPNTYVCLPGFDVDSPVLAQKKVDATRQQLPVIAEQVRQRRTARSLTRGSMARTKTYLLRPLFQKFLLTDRYFKVSNQCNACGLCMAQCPMHDIVPCGEHPTWGHTACIGCLRCYHNCPRRAIDWGRFTAGKQQKRMTLGQL